MMSTDATEDDMDLAPTEDADLDSPSAQVLRRSGSVQGTPVLPDYTPGSGEHGPRFLTGGPGAAPGGVASKNGWVYMRAQGGFISYGYFVCVSVRR